MCKIPYMRLASISLTRNDRATRIISTSNFQSSRLDHAGRRDSVRSRSESESAVVSFVLTLSSLNNTETCEFFSRCFSVQLLSGRENWQMLELIGQRKCTNEQGRKNPFSLLSFLISHAVERRTTLIWGITWVRMFELLGDNRVKTEKGAITYLDVIDLTFSHWEFLSNTYTFF